MNLKRNSQRSISLVVLPRTTTTRATAHAGGRMFFAKPVTVAYRRPRSLTLTLA